MKPSRRSEIDSFRVMDVLNEANRLERSGRSILHLEAGQPSTKAPQTAIRAAEIALRSETLGYTEALGIPVLRERIARHYLEWYGIAVPAERVIVTTGSSAAFVFAFLLLFEQGDTLAISNPGYPAYRNISRALGIQTRLIECKNDVAFRLTADALASAGTINGALIASPSNPCGTIIPPDELKRIAAYCASKDIALISDEIYHGISYGGQAQTALAYSPDVIAINSFSKYFSMTGWRIGWMVVPDHLVAAVERMAQNFYISPPAISQVAAVAAFDARDELEAHVKTYEANRGVLLDAVARAGMTIVAPADGAFYLYADISRFGMTASTFTARLLGEVGVAATPGTDFDPVEGENWIRFSYAGSRAAIREASERLVAWSKANLQK